MSAPFFDVRGSTSNHTDGESRKDNKRTLSPSQNPVLFFAFCPPLVLAVPASLDFEQPNMLIAVAWCGTKRQQSRLYRKGSCSSQAGKNWAWTTSGHRGWRWTWLKTRTLPEAWTFTRCASRKQTQHRAVYDGARHTITPQPWVVQSSINFSTRKERPRTKRHVLKFWERSRRSFSNTTLQSAPTPFFAVRKNITSIF